MSSLHQAFILFLIVPSAVATLASILFLAQVKYTLTTGPLPLQLPLWRMLLDQLFLKFYMASWSIVTPEKGIL